jgi:hypothetical protein
MDGPVWAAAVGIAASGLLGVVGIVQAHRANRHASDSAAVAKEALKLSQSAGVRASRVEQISLERRDVAWSATYVDDVQTLSLQNVGSDTAHDVELVVDPQDGDRRSATLPSVPPTDRIGVRLIDLANEAARGGRRWSPTATSAIWALRSRLG